MLADKDFAIQMLSLLVFAVPFLAGTALSTIIEPPPDKGGKTPASEAGEKNH